MKSTEKVLTGIILGVLAGVVAGILIAPEKGSDTRKKLKKQADKFKDEVATNFDKCKNSVGDFIETELNDFKTKIKTKSES